MTNHKRARMVEDREDWRELENFRQTFDVVPLATNHVILKTWFYSVLGDIRSKLKVNQ